MDSKTLNIMDQLAGAVNTARTASKTIYVFKDGDGWGFSGKMPRNQPNFYIVYPDGDFDQLGEVPRISFGDWGEYLSQVEQPPRFALPPAKAEKKGSLVDPAKKIFITYCAFSPFIALAATFIFHHFAPITDFWTLAFYAAAFCSPLSLIFSLSALQKPKNGKIATMCSMLASDSHLMFYGGLWLISFHGSEIVHPVGTAIALMASLLLSGLALLLMYDNDLQNKVIEKTS